MLKNIFIFSLLFIVLSVPPKITPFNFARDLNVGDRTSIQCVVVTGDLPLTFTWLKDNIKIVSQDVDINGGINGNTIISVNEQKNMDTIWGNMKIANNPSDTINIRQYDAFTSALSVSTITPGHNGTYTCRVTNGASTVKHSALLLVNGKQTVAFLSFFFLPFPRFY